MHPFKCLSLYTEVVLERAEFEAFTMEICGIGSILPMPELVS